MSDPCQEDITKMSINDAYNTVNACARLVYRETLKAATFDVVNKVLEALLSKIQGRNPTFKVIETPRRFEFSSAIDQHRLAPLPVIGITSPSTSEGADFPISYDTIPSVSIDPRSIAVEMSDAFRELASHAKSFTVIVKYFDGSTKRAKLKLVSDIAGTLRFYEEQNGTVVPYQYRMSYDRDYPPKEPPEIYVEGWWYQFKDSSTNWDIHIVEANVVAYRVAGSDAYYSGQGGVVIVFNNYANLVKSFIAFGREYVVENRARLIIVVSNVFTAYAWKPSSSSSSSTST